MLPLDRLPDSPAPVSLPGGYRRPNKVSPHFPSSVGPAHQALDGCAQLEAILEVRRNAFWQRWLLTVALAACPLVLQHALSGASARPYRASLPIIVARYLLTCGYIERPSRDAFACLRLRSSSLCVVAERVRNYHHDRFSGGEDSGGSFTLSAFGAIYRGGSCVRGIKGACSPEPVHRESARAIEPH